MRSFVVCIALVGSALASWGPAPGVPQDTPEVAAAKAAHLAALSRAQSGGHAGVWAGAQDDGQWRDDTHQYNNYAGSWNGNDDGQWRGDSNQWNQQRAWNSWNHEDDGQWRDDTNQHNTQGNSWAEDDGQWRGDNSGAWSGHGAGHWNAGTLINGETPEVAAARAAHLAAHAAASSGHAAAAHPRWRRSLVAVNPNALPVPLDTATVALAKNAQLIQQQTEGARNVLGGGIPLALPADTHEVAIGKQAHAIAHASQRALTAGHGIAVAAAPAVVAAPTVVAAPAVSAHSVWAAPAVSAHSVWAAPAVTVARVVPAAALRHDLQLVSPSIVGVRPVPVAAHGIHW